MGNRSWLASFVLPVLLGVLVLGPALGPGVLLNLDLVVFADLDLPAGFWGLGPELPRRLPLWVPISAVSSLIPATLSTKLLMLLVFPVAWAGMVRFATGLGVRWPLPAAALYALSPFVLTRTAVGHFMVTVPFALLPWVLPRLLRPGRDLTKTFLAAAALSLGGHFGGSLALVVVLVGVLFDRSCARRWRAVAVTLAAQAAWLVPGLLVMLGGDAGMSGSDVFATVSDGVPGLLRLSAGGGFWNSYFQVGGAGVFVAIAGGILLCLAIVGARSMPSTIEPALSVLGLIGFVVAASSGIWITTGAYEWLTSNPIGAVWREGHRLLILYLAWMAPAAALGAERIFARASAVGRPTVGGLVVGLPLALAVALGVPGLWGVGGQIAAERVPEGWSEVRDVVRAESGTVLALPWVQYYNEQFDGGRVRRVLNPLPLFLGGDVLAASNNGLGRGVRERADLRESVADEIVDAMIAGEMPSSSLSELGVRWVVVDRGVRDADYL
ncbi:hypothetical protein, partial [Ilumatobacter sp.]|uniref:hypothetical protein n=1 Tax=Ilumatobacter sp. TaxID=1967498 RepID=UPI003C5AACF0